MAKFLKALVIMSCIATAGYAQQTPPAKPVDPSADAIAARAVDVLGAANWAQARYFAFTFIVERDGNTILEFPERWDRVTGDYRVTGKDPQGRNFDIVMNVNTLKGRVSLEGQTVTDPAKVKDFLTNLGFRRFTNDVFWLLMPLRMTEADVKREYAGERTDSCGRVWDVIKLTFGQTGLLPGDVYWAWVNRDTSMVEEWDMRLQASDPNDRPTEVMLHDYRRVGGLMISLNRQVHGTGQFVRFNLLQILPATPKGAFE